MSNHFRNCLHVLAEDEEEDEVEKSDGNASHIEEDEKQDLR